MGWTISGTLDVTEVAAHLDKVAPPVAAAITALGAEHEIGYCRIDPELADTAAFCDHYGVPKEASANCVIVAGKRSGQTRHVACLALGTTRLNVNTVVRQRMATRKASFAAMDAAVTLTGMEYGGITPLGLPADWPILLGPTVASAPELVIGGGNRGTKLLVTGELLTRLPGAEVVDDLAS